MQKILLVLDSTDKAAQSAIEFCRQLEHAANAEVKVVDILKPIPERWNNYIQNELGQDAASALEQVRVSELEAFLQAQELNWAVQVMHGTAVVEISRLVIRDQVDLVVKAQRVDSDQQFGSLDKQLIRKCPSAVLLVKATQSNKLGRILAAIDPDPDNESQAQLNRSVLLMTKELTQYFNGSLDVVAAWSIFIENYLRSSPLVKMTDEDFIKLNTREEIKHKNMLMDLAKSIELEIGEHNLHLFKGAPEHVVPHTASETHADLLVMGSLGRAGVPGLFIGNTAEKIIDILACSVLAIKPPGYSSPLKL